MLSIYIGYESREFVWIVIYKSDEYIDFLKYSKLEKNGKRKID